MEKSEQLLDAIKEMLDSKFRLVVKESCWWGRLHSRIFGQYSAFILGHTCYAPKAVLEHVDALEELLVHEGTHLAQKKDLGVIRFNWRYGFPQIWGALAVLLGLLVGIISSICAFYIGILPAVIAILYGIFSAVNWKMAHHRYFFEVEAYALSTVLVRTARSRDDSTFFVSWVTEIQRKLSSITYLYCGRDVLGFDTSTFLHAYSMGLFSEKSLKPKLFQWYSRVKEIFLA